MLLFVLGWAWASALPSHATDSFMYLWQADLFQTTPVSEWLDLIKGFSKSFYSLLVALLALPGANLEHVGFFVSIVAGIVTVVVTGCSVVYFSGRTDNRPLWLSIMLVNFACGALALHPIFINYSSRILSESSFTALSVIALFFTILTARSSSITWSILAGAAIGFCGLTREVGLAFIPLFALLSFSCKTHWAKRLFISIVGCAVAIGINLPVLMSGAQSSMGEYNLAGHQATFDQLTKEKVFCELDADAEAFLIDSTSHVSLPELFLNDFGNMVCRTGANLYNLGIILKRLVGWVLILLALIGIGSWARDVFSDPAKLVILGFAAVTLLVYLPFHLEFRYLVPILPFAVIFSAAGLELLLSKASQTRIRPVFVFFIVVLLVGYSHCRTYAIQVSPQKNPASNLLEEQELGLWMKNKISPDSTVMARKPNVPYYANAKFVKLPFDDWSRIHHYACINGIDYLVLSQRYRWMRPQLDFLYDTSTQHSGVSLAADITAENGIRLVVYRFWCPKSDTTTKAGKSNNLLRYGH